MLKMGNQARAPSRCPALTAAPRRAIAAAGCTRTWAGMRQLQESSAPLYERTRLFRIYEHTALPGLFHTAEYSMEIMSYWVRFLGLPDDAEAAAAARLARQKVLRSGRRRFIVVLAEQALRTRLGTPQVMTAQLEHLLEVMRLPNVSVGIIPAMAERYTVAQVPSPPASPSTFTKRSAVSMRPTSTSSSAPPATPTANAPLIADRVRYLTRRPRESPHGTSSPMQTSPPEYDLLESPHRCSAHGDCGKKAQLRLAAHRRWGRREDRASQAAACVGEDHVGHVRSPLARQGQVHEGCHRCGRRGEVPRSCGLCAD